MLYKGKSTNGRKVSGVSSHGTVRSERPVLYTFELEVSNPDTLYTVKRMMNSRLTHSVPDARAHLNVTQRVLTISAPHPIKDLNLFMDEVREKGFDGYTISIRRG
ncbi:MAG: hypothetical protein WCK90_00765 [archaeon]